MIIIIMWCQRVCNCRQYCFDLVGSHQCNTAYIGTMGIYTRDYPEQLWFPLNEIHQSQLLRVNRGKPQFHKQQLMHIHHQVLGTIHNQHINYTSIYDHTNSLLCTIEGEGSGREELHEEVELRLQEVRGCTLRGYLYRVMLK